MPAVYRNGVKIHYEMIGAGPPVLFIHPHTTNSSVWCYQAQIFAREYCCLTMDLRGHGHSDKPRSGYAIGEHAADVACVLRLLGLSRAAVVGNSIGGAVALQLSIDHPELVAGNMIISTAMGLPKDQTHLEVEEIRRDYLGYIDRKMEKAFSAASRRNRPEILAFIQALLRKDNFPEHIIHASLDDPGSIFYWNIENQLKTITQPTLVLAGEEDGAVPPHLTRALAEGIPGAAFRLVRDVGHFYELERPHDFNAELGVWLQTLWADGHRDPRANS
ncbi:MAG TPA: alpha/beta fold hydrolase [Terriglobales bacterium]|jgi:3-oxoadipate enol-lactonase|nr:alpha/beta fold hydrolase [Terriglobales bacterium]